MTKDWYPIIDYALCTECGACVQKCKNGVYDVEKAPHPLVIQGDNCIYQCHGCGDLCPSAAITYFGENTGWKPHNKLQLQPLGFHLPLK